jgi:uncharacterized membrane protein
MKTFRPIIVLALLGLSVPAFAEPEYLELFMSHYHVKENSPLGTKSCGICHVSEDDTANFNAYGADVKKALHEQTNGKFTWVTLALVEPNDSSGSGKSNLLKIAAGELPGATVAKSTTETETPKSLIPRHGYHPAIVHFPIALILVAFLLDLGAIFLKKPFLRVAGTYNLVLGGLAGLFAIATGFWATALKHLPIKLLMTHLTVGIASIVCVAICLLARRGTSTGAKAVTFVALLAAVILISSAGHFGGLFVYGE